MANNTNVQAILVSDQHVRPMADFLGQVYNRLKAESALDAAQSWNTLFPAADPTGEVIDTARTDGRPVVTNGDVQNIRAVVAAFITWMEATSNQRLNQVLKVAVNPQR